MTIGILGGGLTGCTLGRLFAERGWSFEILESESEIGGLLRSTKVDGFTFDLGGPHILFSKNKQALEFLLNTIAGNVSTMRRNTKVLFRGRFVKYPFENGLSDLPLMDNFACLSGFTLAAIGRKARRQRKSENLREWCIAAFGKGISKRYLIPYNEKIWKHPLTDISTEWVERIPNPPWTDILKSSIGIETEGYAHQLNFNYPRNGGIEAVIRGLTKDFSDRITKGFEVKSISKSDGRWHVSDGKRTRSYDAIISTIPLSSLVEVMHLPEPAVKAAQDLKVNSVICVCLGGVKPRKTDLSWLYMPAKNVLVHRVSFLSNSSDMTAPPGKHSFIADMTCKYNDEAWKTSDEELVQRTVCDLVAQGVLESGDFETSLVMRQRYAYVIDDLNRKKNVEILKKYLDEIGLLTCGRFGEFEYLNMDAVVTHAFNLVMRHESVLEQAG